MYILYNNNRGLEVVVVTALSTTLQAESHLAVIVHSLPHVASLYNLTVGKGFHVLCKYQYVRSLPFWIC